MQRKLTAILSADVADYAIVGPQADQKSAHGEDIAVRSHRGLRYGGLMQPRKQLKQSP